MTNAFYHVSFKNISLMHRNSFPLISHVSYEASVHPNITDKWYYRNRYWYAHNCFLNW